jgi:hypothetical protein
MLRSMFRLAPSLIGAGLLILAAPPVRAAPAADDALMADFFKGTLEIDVPAGGPWSAKSYLSPDHTFRMVGTDGEVRGTWAVKEGKLCTTSDRDPGPDQLKTYCNVGVGKHLGESWKDNDPVTGNLVLFRLVAGRS